MITQSASYDNSTPVMQMAYDPLRVAAYAGQFGNMPAAQYLTPAEYGAYRDTPTANVNITPNMQPGFLTNLATAYGWPFTYNPAVNPMVYRAHAARQASDQMAAFGFSMLDFGAETLLGMGAGALVGGGVAGLAAGVAAPMLLPASLSATAVSDRIREARAVQQRSMAKITSGSELDLATGMGFSSAAASNIDRFIRKQGAGDWLFKEGDFRNILHTGMEIGMFDFAGNTSEQYKRQLKKLRDVLGTAMSVLGSTDFKELLKDLRRLQTLGLSTEQMGRALRREEGYARMAGLSQQELVARYGQPGAVMASQRGFAGYIGSQAMESHAAALSLARQNGVISPSRLAALGGEQGYATAATEATLNAEQNFEMLIAASVSKNRGREFDYKKMVNLLQKADTDKNFNLAREALSSAGGSLDAITMQNLEINSKEFVKHFYDKLGEDNKRKFQRQAFTGIGADILQSFPNATDEDKFIAGYRRITNASAAQAAMTYNVYYNNRDFDNQNKYSSRIELLRRREEERERDRFYNRASVVVRKFINNLSDYAIGGFTHDLLKKTDARAKTAAGGGVSPSVTEQEMETYRKRMYSMYGGTEPSGKDSASIEPMEFDSDFAESIQRQSYDANKYEPLRYDRNNRPLPPTAAGKKAVNSASWTAELNATAMENANEAAHLRGQKDIFSADIIRSVRGAWNPSDAQREEDTWRNGHEDFRVGSAGTFAALEKANVNGFEFTQNDLDKLTNGTIIYSRDIDKAKHRYKNITKSGTVYVDENTGKKRVSYYSDKEKAVITAPLEEYLNTEASGINGKFLAQSLRDAATEDGRRGSAEYREERRKEINAQRAEVRNMLTRQKDADLFAYMTTGKDAAVAKVGDAMNTLATLNGIDQQAERIAAGEEKLDINGSLGIDSGKKLDAVISDSMRSLMKDDGEAGMDKLVTSLVSLANKKDIGGLDKQALLIGIGGGSWWNPGTLLSNKTRFMLTGSDKDMSARAAKAVLTGIRSGQIRIGDNALGAFNKAYEKLASYASNDVNMFGEGIQKETMDDAERVFKNLSASLSGDRYGLDRAIDETAFDEARNNAIRQLASGLNDRIGPEAAMHLMAAVAYNKAYTAVHGSSGEYGKYDTEKVRKNMKEGLKKTFAIVGRGDITEGKLEYLLDNPGEVLGELNLGNKNAKLLDLASGSVNVELMKDLMDVDQAEYFKKNGRYSIVGNFGEFLAGNLATDTEFTKALYSRAGKSGAVLSSVVGHLLGDYSAGDLFKGTSRNATTNDAMKKNMDIIHANAADAIKRLKEVADNKNTDKETRDRINTIAVPYLEKVMRSTDVASLSGTLGTTLARQDFSGLVMELAKQDKNVRKASAAWESDDAEGKDKGKETGKVMFDAAKTFDGSVDRFTASVMAMYGKSRIREVEKYMGQIKENREKQQAEQ